MKNTLKKTIFSTILLATMVTSFQTQAIVSIATGSIGGAIAGLVLITPETAIDLTGGCTAFGCIEYVASRAAELSYIVGLIVLDGEDGQQIQFKNIDQQQLLKMGLTEDEAIAYNDNVEELSAAFNEVSRNLTKDSSKDDAVKLWQEQQEILGTAAISGARKVVQFNLKK
jgi:hypothetical protein